MPSFSNHRPILSLHPMKTSTLILTILLGIVMCVLCCYQALTSYQRQTDRLQAQVQAVAKELPAVIGPLRERITFILGEDRTEDNPYYEEARNYYMENPVGRTEYIVPGCRSLLEVRDYLERYKPCNGEPWGLINLVSHGNQWTGLSVRVTPDIRRTTAEKLEACVKNGALMPLPETLVDEQTEIILHGCGVGQNPRLVDALARVFGAAGHLPVVRASKLFEYYASLTDRDRLQTERYLADTWMVSYRMGERPADGVLTNRLREAYPQAPVDWAGALSRRQPRWVGDTYHYTFEVPVKWVLKLSHDSIPGKAVQLDWLGRRREITAGLDALQIPYDQFRWSFTGVYATNDDGSTSPAIWVKGYCTVLAVLQALTTGEDGHTPLRKPLEPALGDANYYYTAGSRCCDDAAACADECPTGKTRS